MLWSSRPTCRARSWRSTTWTALRRITPWSPPAPKTVKSSPPVKASWPPVSPQPNNSTVCHVRLGDRSFLWQSLQSPDHCTSTATAAAVTPTLDEGPNQLLVSDSAVPFLTHIPTMHHRDQTIFLRVCSLNPFSIFLLVITLTSCVCFASGYISSAVCWSHQSNLMVSHIAAVEMLKSSTKLLLIKWAACPKHSVGQLLNVIYSRLLVCLWSEAFR